MNHNLKHSNILIIILILSFLGCGSTTTNSKTSLGRNNVITREEIQQLSVRYNVTNAYDLVNAKKPNWLYNLRGEVVVFHNGMRYGDPNSLRDFNVSNIVEIRRVGLEGSIRYVRSDHPTTVILIETK